MVWSSSPSFNCSRRSGSVGVPLDDGISKRGVNLNVLIWVVKVDLEIQTKRRSILLVIVARVNERGVERIRPYLCLQLHDHVIQPNKARGIP